MKLYWCCGCLVSAEGEADARAALGEAGQDPSKHGYRPEARLTEIPEGQIVRGWGGGRMSAKRWADMGRFVKNKAGKDLLPKRGR